MKVRVAADTNVVMDYVPDLYIERASGPTEEPTQDARPQEQPVAEEE